MRLCSRCRTEKPLAEFGPWKRHAHGLNCYCRDCVRLLNAEYYSRHKEKMQQRRRDNYRRDIHRERAYNDKYDKENVEKRRAHRRAVAEKLKENSRRWSKAHAPECRARGQARRAREKHAIPSWANLAEIQRRFDWAHMLTEEFGIPFEVDHVIPLQGKTVCGLHCETNLQVITRRMNREKANSVWPDMPERSRA